LPERPDDFAGIREAAGVALRVDECAIGNDVEDPAAALDEFRFDTELPGNFGRQTGGLRQVVSDCAVGDGDAHGVSPSAQWFDGYAGGATTTSS
jgi:hypothetical protein